MATTSTSNTSFPISPEGGFHFTPRWHRPEVGTQVAPGAPLEGCHQKVAGSRQLPGPIPRSGSVKDGEFGSGSRVFFRYQKRPPMVFFEKIEMGWVCQRWRSEFFVVFFWATFYVSEGRSCFQEIFLEKITIGNHGRALFGLVVNLATLSCFKKSQLMMW